MELLIILTVIAAGSAVASFGILAWAASQLRWLAAHCHQHIRYWQREAERAKAIAAALREQHAADRQ
jgi:hypothetical protein